VPESGDRGCGHRAVVAALVRKCRCRKAARGRRQAASLASTLRINRSNARRILGRS
jgi:hypothetical protein